MRQFILILALLLPTHASSDTALDVTKVTEGVYAIVGPYGQRDAENLGNNATFGLIVGDSSAILIDAGGSYLGAQALHDSIRTVTDLPITHVINTGGQDHRWIGNSYWYEHGAQIIASNDAVSDQRARVSMQETVLTTLLGDAVEGTAPNWAGITFDSDYVLELDGMTVEIHHAGAAHTPGDSFVWLPDRSVMFTGDIVYVGRILGVMEFSSSRNWLTSFETMAAYGPEHIVPGHGPATDLATARRDSYDYLVNLRNRMADHIDNGGDIIESVTVDQSAFEYLHSFELLAGRNAQEVYSQMEWE